MALDAATLKVVLAPAQIVLEEGSAVIAGSKFTIPDNATFFVVIPVEEIVIFPAGVPVAVAARRTYMVLFILPEEGVNDKLVV
ncbi:hypothetical protein D3C87_841350 [compost metagenome]